ncbi:MAG: prefoldin subunit alpha [Candidatus Bathyarchaeota archaeon]|nr:prefoldin subunit alpha [Candidatus Bathyarchaeota archaeon]
MSASSGSIEDEIRRLIVELRLLENTAENLQLRLNLVNANLTELNLASMSLEGIEKKDSNHIFVPIGGGSYIKAVLEETDKVVYGVGAGIAIEKTIKEAKEDIANRIAELNKARAALEQQLNQVLTSIRERQARLQELTSRLKRQG